MDQARRRLLHLGLASAATGLTAVPMEGWAKGRHGGGAHHQAHSGHATHNAHAALHGHGGHHDRLARLERRHHGHGAHGDAHPLVQQARIDLGAAPRRVKFHNLHTDEKLDAVFWENGEYVSDALHAVNHVLRDFRTNTTHEMNPGLLDLLTAVSAKTESSSPFYVISGYRSPQTNAMLRNEGGEGTGVARKSLHMEGEAIDIRLGDVALNHLHNAALSLRAGGVGYYPTSNFVHMDVGPVRQWGGV
jgi:uncharacterized protein YcbK (DUF882 family)